MAIIVKQNGSKAVRVEKTHFAREDALQRYIYESPESLPLDDIEEDTKLLILAREFPTNSGPIDALGIDQRGALYIIETKLYKNPDKRTVIAQALDYGAALWKHSSDFSQFLATLENFTRKTFGLGLREKLAEFFELDQIAVESVLETTRKNLNNGVYQFVVLMDKLDDRLKDLILYVNQNSQFDIYAVELEYYKHESYEIVIPRLYGAEVKKDFGSSSQSRKAWTAPELMQEAQQKLSPAGFVAFKKVYDFTQQHADELRLGTGSYGSFSAIFYPLSKKSIFTLATDNRLSLNFKWLAEDNPKSANSFKAKIEPLGFSLPQNFTEFRPGFSEDKWISQVDRFLETIESMLQE